MFRSYISVLFRLSSLLSTADCHEASFLANRSESGVIQEFLQSSPSVIVFALKLSNVLKTCSVPQFLRLKTTFHSMKILYFTRLSPRNLFSLFTLLISIFKYTKSKYVPCSAFQIMAIPFLTLLAYKIGAPFVPSLLAQ